MRFKIAFLASIGCSCMVTKGVVNPYTYAPKQAPTLYQIPLDITPVNDQQRDTPLNLPELIDIALRNNPSTRITWAKARAAAAVWAQTQSYYFPTLSGNYSVTRSKTSSVETAVSSGTGTAASGLLVFSQTSTEWGPQIQLNYTLLDFGLTSAQVRAAKEALLSADFTHNFQIQTVLQKVASDYYNYLSQLQQLKSLEADLHTATVTQDVVKREVESGVKDISDLLQAQTQFLQTQIQLTQQKQNVISAKALLLTDVGLGAQAHVEISNHLEIPSLDLVEKSVDEVLTVALTKRNDLLAREAYFKSQQAEVDASWREFLPNVTYDLSASKNRVKPGGNLGLNYTSVVAVNIPIFSGFLTWNQLREARSHRDEAAAEVKQTELQVAEDVITAHKLVQTSLESLRFSDELLKKAEQQYEIALSRYKAGVANILELITAQNTLASSRSQNVSSTTQWLNSILNLSYAAGSLVPVAKKEPQ